MAALTSVVDEHHLHTLVQQRRSSSVFGAVLTNKDVQQGTALEVQGILDDNGTPEQKTTLMHGIFAKYATWEFNANACYISRTKFRRFCYDANIVSPRGLLVGDIEVVFYESLKEEPSNGNQVLAKRKEKRVSSRDFNKWKDKKFIEKKGQENRMLSFQQFVSALGMVALKIFGPKRFEHLDPRLCTRVASVDEPFHLFYNKVLLPFAARNGLFAESLQALELSDVEKQTLPEALALIQVEKRAFTEIFSFYSQKDTPAQGMAEFDTRRSLSFNEVHNFCRDFDVVPGICSISQILLAFRQTRQGTEVEGEDAVDAELDFSEFCLFIGVIALRHTEVHDDKGSRLLRPSVRNMCMEFFRGLEKSDGCKIMALTLRNGRHVRFVNKSTQFQ